MRNLGNLISTDNKKEWISVCCETINLYLKKKIVTNSELNIAISGGSTPQVIFQELIKEKYLSHEDWKKVNFYWVDERLVKIESPESNFGNAHNILKEIPATFYPMFDINKGEKQSLTTYRNLLQKIKSENGFPVFDLILLGIGEDGHTASLFPLTEGLSETKQSVIIHSIEHLNCKRMSLTFPVLRNANKCLIIFNGNHKMELLKNLIEKEQDYPIELLLKDSKSITWIYYN